LQLIPLLWAKRCDLSISFLGWLLLECFGSL